MNIQKNQTAVIICIGIVICAVLVIYNAFYQPQAQIVKFIPMTSEEISEMLYEVSNSHFKNGLLNINLATEDELSENLDGISTTLAGRIIEYRNENGDFKDISEIKNVKGIGENKFQNIKDKICV